MLTVVMAAGFILPPMVGSARGQSLLSTLTGENAPAEIDDVGLNDFGMTGLMQTPTARMGRTGNFGVGASFVGEYYRYFLGLHALPWLEGTFRYTDIRNRLFSDSFAFSGNQSFKDRGADLKFLLIDEGDFIPAIALGVQDGLGTGQFSGEYIVASKRWYDLDFSFGMGWGYYAGSKGVFSNPLAKLSDSFKKRGATSAFGGTANISKFFRGETVGLFGGVHWRTPLEGLSVKIEYESKDYANEPKGNVFEQALNLNFGINYRPFDWVDIAVGLERGNTFSFRTVLRSNLNTASVPKFDPPPVALKPRPPADAYRGKKKKDPPPATAALMERHRRAGLQVVETALRNDQFQLAVIGDMRRLSPARRNELAWETFADLPASIDSIAYLDSARNWTVLRRADVTRDKIVDRLFDVLEAENLPVQDIAFDQWQLRIRLGDAGRNPLSPARRAALRMLDVLPAPVQRIVFRLPSGRSISFSRDELRNAASAGAIFRALQGAGMDVSRIDWRNDVVAIYGIARGLPDPARYRRAAEAIGAYLPGNIRRVDIIANGMGIVSVYTNGWRPVGGRTAAVAMVSASGSDNGQSGDASRDEAEKRAIADALFKAYAKRPFRIDGVYVGKRRAEIYFEPKRFRKVARNIGRVARIAANVLPADIEEITLVQVNRGLELSRVSIIRSDLEKALKYKGSAEEVWANALIEPGRGLLDERPPAIENPERYPDFDWRLTPRLRQHVGGPEGFYLYQIYAALGASVSPLPGLKFAGTAGFDITNTFDKLRQSSDSVLPHVRSDINSYLKEGKTGIINLYADYVFSPVSQWYVKATAGLFEEMYGGVAGEVLYKPIKSPFAVGAELAWVKKRDFDQLFSFRDYDVWTGHASLYYQMPVYDLFAYVSAGRYLAGDVGATFSLARTFDSGVTVGAFFTLTDVPFDEFGEGSFDKGFFIQIPFDIFLTRSTRRRGTFAFRPLTRDGGQKVEIPGRLYGLLGDSSADLIGRSWGTLFE